MRMGRNNRRSDSKLEAERIGSVGNRSRDIGVDLPSVCDPVQAVAAPAIWPYPHRTLAEVDKDMGDEISESI